MTKYFKSLLVALAVITISCSDDEPSKTSEMIVDGAAVKIENAYFTKSTDRSTNKTYYTIYFASEGISLENYPNYDAIVGSGKFFSLMLETSDANNLPAGEYATTEYASLYELVNDDWDFITDDLTLDGVIKVSKSGSNYTFEFAFTGVNDCSVYYTGPLTTARLAS
ncbi:MAG: hypothetical protein EBR30_17715 [Cytophagia bacterium]|nr:hypothetical protein [Cytophagia bacterium]NBW36823.1 hypothetical protein [Cytophagia bacterium]